MRLASLLVLTFALSLIAACEESTNQQTDPAAVERGQTLFITYCVLCHGTEGLGDGRLAVNKMPPPANLRRSILTREQMIAIISRGGAAVGRSGFMPPWGEELGAEKIDDIVAYILTLRKAD